MKKNQNAQIAQKENASNSKLISANLEKFADQLSGIQLKEKKDRESFYIYPSEFSKSDISSEIGKKWRNNKRSRIAKFCNNILIFAKIKDEGRLQKEIADFMKFYKEFYKINDLSFSSLSHSKDEGKEKNISLALQIIKSLQ